MERMDWHEYEADDDCLKKSWIIFSIFTVLFVATELLFFFVFSWWWLIPLGISVTGMFYGLYRTSKC